MSARSSAGSAFDAFVEYELSHGRLGFIDVECKYAENLANAQRRAAPAKYNRAGEFVQPVAVALVQTNAVETGAE